jgi:hypothetical protein
MSKETSMNTQPKGLPAGIGYVLLAFGLFFLCVAVFNDLRLALLGLTTEGEIIRITEKVSRSDAKRRPGESLKEFKKRDKGGISYILTLRYTPQGGAPIEIDTRATWGLAEKVGDRVPVIYLPGSPRGADINSVKQVWLPLATGFTVSAFCLISGGWIVRAARRRGGSMPEKKPLAQTP